MNLWTEVHWSEGLFLRPHHLQAYQRWVETLLRSGLDSIRPFAWGFSHLDVAEEPLENFTIRLDSCGARMKDGTWVQVPDNTQVEPLNFEDAMKQLHGEVDIHFGIPEMQEVRANSVSMEDPDRIDGTPRFEPHSILRRDENTGGNPQMIYVRRMRGRLFTEGEDMTGYDTIRLGRVKRSDKPGAVPEFDADGAGPLLAIQAHEKLSRNINSLIDQIEAKDEVLAREAKEHKMAFTDGVSANMEHLLKLHALNEARGHLRAFQQSPMIPPYDVYIALSRLIGHLSVFHEDLVPGVIPPYKHDHPGETFAKIQDRIQILLDAMRPQLYVQREFARKKDAQGREGLEVEVDRPWIDDNLEMFVGLFDEERDINELQKHMYSRLNFKLASPTRAPKIVNIAVRGLRLEVKAVPAGTLPRRQGLHYYKINKTMGADRTDYWRECEQERGIRISVQEGQLNEMEQFRPALFVILKER